MPKKYKQKSLLTKPTSSAPSTLSLSHSSSSRDVDTQKTVNDLIRESRQGAAQEYLPNTPSITSVPPEVRAVLDVPLPPSPVPRSGLRGPSRLRRIPGPPPPRSWLTDSRHAPAAVRDVPWSRAHYQSRIQSQTSKLPGGTFPNDASLQHLVLKSMSTRWSWHAQYDHEYLAELPTVMKETLLSYIAIYGDGQGPNSLRLLFPNDLNPVETAEVKRLDLGNAIGGWSTLKKIEKELEVDILEKGAVNSIARPQLDVVPDTWDEESLVVPPPVPGSMSHKGMRFRNLKHLSLAVAPGCVGAVASWAGLLGVAAKFSTITSLSLAYWPVPTYTPNASTGMRRVEVVNSSVPMSTYGGTNFYTAFDNDWREAAGILRSLSRSLYCLKWLDLTGCGQWYSALKWVPSAGRGESAPQSTGPDWNGSWRSLEHLILAVGWVPEFPSAIETTVSASVQRKGNQPVDRPQQHLHETIARLSSMRLGSVREIEHAGTDNWDVEDERAKYYYRMEVRKYTAILQCAREVATHLRATRKQHGGKWLHVDFGIEEEHDIKD